MVLKCMSSLISQLLFTFHDIDHDFYERKTTPPCYFRLGDAVQLFGNQQGNIRKMAKIRQLQSNYF